MKATPGPWTAHDDDGTGTLPCVLSDKVNAGGNFYVAQCNVFADAVLIAAAPELLEACKALLSKESEMTTGACYLEFRAIEAAIARAEGGE